MLPNMGGEWEDVEHVWHYVTSSRNEAFDDFRADVVIDGYKQRIESDPSKRDEAYARTRTLACPISSGRAFSTTCSSTRFSDTSGVEYITPELYTQITRSWISPHGW